ncbi:MAG: hypothetical protein K2Q32_09020 [Alphaproteobacteria bacterium]|nr:hypothetical protein [Alphaproteobacteria bacterium]
MTSSDEHIMPSLMRAEKWDTSQDWPVADDTYSTDEWLKIKSLIEPLLKPYAFRDVVPALMIVASNYSCACITRNADKVVGFKYRSSKNRARLRKALSLIQKIKSLVSQQHPLNRNDLLILRKASHLISQRTLLLQLSQDTLLVLKNLTDWLASRGKQIVNIDAVSEVLNALENVFLQHIGQTSRGGTPNKHERRAAIKGLMDIWVEYTGTQSVVSTNRDTGVIGGGFVDFVYAVLTPLSKRADDATDIGGLADAIKKEYLTMHKKQGGFAPVCFGFN